VNIEWQMKHTNHFALQTGLDDKHVESLHQILSCLFPRGAGVNYGCSLLHKGDVQHKILEDSKGAIVHPTNTLLIIIRYMKLYEQYVILLSNQKRMKMYGRA
jgi:hypothetical protein